MCFLRTLACDRKLLDPGLSQCSRHGMFLNLLYKSLKSDVVLRRVKAFVKRLLQVSCEQNPTFACGALFLVSEVMKAKPGLRVLLQDSSVSIALVRSTTEVSSVYKKITLYCLTLIYTSVKLMLLLPHSHRPYTAAFSVA